MSRSRWRSTASTVHAAGNLGDDPAQAQGGGRGLSRPHVRKAVITVPAYFNDAQRQATIDAPRSPASTPNGRSRTQARQEDASSGCASSTSRPPPSLAYGLDKKKNEKIAVFDLGGGTFDISILDVGDGVFQVEVDQRRHAPGRRRLRSGADRLHRRRVQEGERHRPAQGPDGLAAAEGSRRAGQEGPVAAGDDGHQSAVHHGGRDPARNICKCR